MASLRGAPNASTDRSLKLALALAPAGDGVAGTIGADEELAGAGAGAAGAAGVAILDDCAGVAGGLVGVGEIETGFG
jgi:hypothetical protein